MFAWVAAVSVKKIKSFLEAQQCHKTAVHKCIKNSGNVSFVDDKKKKKK